MPNIMVCYSFRLLILSFENCTLGSSVIMGSREFSFWVLRVYVRVIDGSSSLIEYEACELEPTIALFNLYYT